MAISWAGSEVVVEQTQHRFLFGCIGFDLIDLLSPTRLRTDADGQIAVSGFVGDYRVSVPGVGQADIALTTAGESRIDAHLAMSSHG